MNSIHWMEREEEEEEEEEEEDQLIGKDPY
jgi:hypothetical protein